MDPFRGRAVICYFIVRHLLEVISDRALADAPGFSLFSHAAQRLCVYNLVRGGHLDFMVWRLRSLGYREKKEYPDGRCDLEERSLGKVENKSNEEVRQHKVAYWQMAAPRCKHCPVSPR